MTTGSTRLAGPHALLPVAALLILPAALAAGCRPPVESSKGREDVSVSGDAAPVPAPADAHGAEAALAPIEVCEEPARDTESCMRAKIMELYKPQVEGFILRVLAGGKKLDLPPECTVDIEQGAGHGFSLSFLRFNLHQSQVKLEEVLWKGTAGEGKKGSVRRLTVDRATVDPFLELLRLLPALTLEEVDTRPKVEGHGSGGGWGSSTDFFVLVRVTDRDGKVLHEGEYGGYEGSLEQLAYLPLRVVGLKTQALMDALAGWQPVEGELMRQSHFTDAFNLDQAVMLEDFHWWVLEYSTEALGYVGNPKVIGALEGIRKNHPKLSDRQKKKIDAVLNDPDRYLIGPPADVPDQ